MLKKRYSFPVFLAVLFIIACKNPASSDSVPLLTGGTIDSVIIDTPPSFLPRGVGAYQFTALVAGTAGVSQSVIWSLTALNEYGKPNAPTEGTVIDQAGKLSIAPDEKAMNLIIRAMSAEDPSKQDETTVKLLAKGEKSVNVSGQRDAPLTFGTAGTAAYVIITTNITDGTGIIVKWYNAETGGNPVPAPSGVTDNTGSLTINSNSVNLKLITTAVTPAGTHWFTVIIDGVESSPCRSLRMERRPITALVISGLNAPEAPEVLDNKFTAILNTLGTSVEWYIDPAGEGMASGYAEYNKVYWARISLTADDNHNFNGLKVNNITAPSGINTGYEENGFTGGKKLTLSEDLSIAIIDFAFPVTLAEPSSLPPLAPVGKPTLNDTGGVTWTNVPDAEGYIIKLYKDGDADVAATVSVSSGDSVSVLQHMRDEGAGSYTVTVTAMGNGTTHSNSPASEPSNPQIVSQRTRIGYLWWVDGSAKARWINTDDTGDYTVQLYKEGETSGSPVNISRGTIDDTNPKKATEHDFSAAIRDAGDGSYAFEVTAKSGDTLGLDSEPALLPAAKPFTVPSVTAGVMKLISVNQAVLELSFSEPVTVSGVSPYGLSLTGSLNTVMNINDVSGSEKNHAFVLSAPADAAEIVTLGYTGEAVKNGDGISPMAFTSKTIAKQLIAPEPSLNDHGVASWTALSAGMTSASYTVQLYKDGSPLGLPVTPAASFHDFLSGMRTGGTGTYTVRVSAALAGYGDSGQSGASNAQTVTQRPQVQNLWWFDPIHPRWVNPDGSGDYTVQLYKDGNSAGEPISVARENTQNPGNPNETITTFSIGNEIIVHGPGAYTFKVTAKGNTALILDSPESSASVPGSISRFDIIMEQWERGASSVTLSENAVLTSGSFNIPKGKTLVIGTGYTLTAGLLELAAGTWKAIGQNVSIEANTISLQNGLGAKFGMDDGTAATVLAGPFQDGKHTGNTRYTASGAKVTIGQNGTSLTISSASPAVFSLDSSAGIYIKSGLSITNVGIQMYQPNDYTSVLYLYSGGSITMAEGSRIELNSGNDPVQSNWWGTNTLDVGTGISVTRINNSDHRIAVFTGIAANNTITPKGGEYWIAKNNTHDSR